MNNPEVGLEIIRGMTGRPSVGLMVGVWRRHAQSAHLTISFKKTPHDLNSERERRSKKEKEKERERERGGGRGKLRSKGNEHMLATVFLIEYKL